MVGEGKEDVLGKIQDKLDDAYLEFVKKDFDLKVTHHKRIKEDLEKRDNMLKEMPVSEKARLVKTALMRFEAFHDLLPQNAKEEPDCSFIDFIKAEFMDDGKMRVVMTLNENEFVANEKLEKTIYLFEKEPEVTKIEWKDERGLCPILDFFESLEDDMEIFDIIYELYVNLIFYSRIED